MNENIELYFKILSGVIAALLGYHKYMAALLDKKMDKDDCSRERTYLERLREEDRKTLFNNIKEIKEKTTSIEQHLLNQKK